MAVHRLTSVTIYNASEPKHQQHYKSALKVERSLSDVERLIQRHFCAVVWICGKSRSQQVLSNSKKKVEGNHAFFKDN